MSPQEPTGADRALAAQLVAEGWVQIRRWATPPPSGRHLVAPEHRDTAWGRRVAAAIERFVTSADALIGECPHYDVTRYPADGPVSKGRSASRPLRTPSSRSGR